MIGWMNGAKKKWMVMGLLVGVLLVGISIAIVLFYRQSQIKKEGEFAVALKVVQPEEMPMGMPKKPFYEYDTTEHKAMFIIMGVQAEEQTMQLKFIYPFKWRDNEITAKVTCGKNNTWVYWGKEDSLVRAEKIVYEEARVAPGQTVMQVICADQYCRSIRKYCELWL